MIKYTTKQYHMLEALYDMIDTVSLKNKTYSDYVYLWKRQISNGIFDIKANGYPTGLITKNALKTNNPYYVKDHVYSRNTVADHLIDEYKRSPFTLEWLRDNFPKFATSIFVTQSENMMLGRLASEMSLNQLMRMEHYKAAGIELVNVPSNRVKKFPQLITEHMDQLMAPNLNKVTILDLNKVTILDCCK
ncbi:MAG: hypothetical protein H8E03_00545 [Pelagibacteraceae bacterium]|nr:hypothetical protein [Pelagibacteraceae bacterium]